MCRQYEDVEDEQYEGKLVQFTTRCAKLRENGIVFLNHMLHTFRAKLGRDAVLITLVLCKRTHT